MAMFVQILGYEATCRDHSAFRIEAGEAKDFDRSVSVR
jgi:hypothetical protein